MRVKPKPNLVEPRLNCNILENLEELSAILFFKVKILCLVWIKINGRKGKTQNCTTLERKKINLECI